MIHEAIKAVGGKGKDPKTKEGLDFCSKLYGIEKELVDVSPEKRHEERLLHSKPVLEAFLVWLKETKEISLPQSHLVEAIDYCLNQWESLNTFLLDGHLEIDINRPLGLSLWLVRTLCFATLPKVLSQVL